jgi:hypothetical protein
MNLLLEGGDRRLMRAKLRRNNTSRIAPHACASPSYFYDTFVAPKIIQGTIIAASKRLTHLLATNARADDEVYMTQHLVVDAVSRELVTATYIFSINHT